MIWNPWKEIKRLREEIAQKDAVLEMRLEDWTASDTLATDRLKHIRYLNGRLNIAFGNWKYQISTLRQIAAMEKPTVENIMQVATHALMIAEECLGTFERNEK